MGRKENQQINVEIPASLLCPETISYSLSYGLNRSVDWALLTFVETSLREGLFLIQNHGEGNVKQLNFLRSRVNS